MRHRQYEVVTAGGRRALPSLDVNRTDRLYAIVEELRAAVPGSRTSGELAARFEVSGRTVERDILALQEAGVPIHSTTGRRGGYTIDKARTLPPINFSPAEATAIAVALVRNDDGPFSSAGLTARRKVLEAMSAVDAERAKALAARIRLMTRPDRVRRASVPNVLQDAVAEHLVVRVDYVDRAGVTSQRELEPVAVIGIDDDWYLMAFCRLRHDFRSFRFDRIAAATTTGERAPDRPVDELVGRIPEFVPIRAPFE
jgi:predicted DNA-binding transcriptional regulator YafY